MSGNRYFSRIKFPAHVQIEFNDTTHTLELFDISLRGALLHSQIPILLKTGTCCILKVYLPLSTIILTFHAELVHLHGNNFGFKFLDADVDTMTHLRNLLGYNIGNPDQITHEFHFWLDSV
jgi:hypothetical protein